MKANKIHSLVIIIQTVISTLYYSLQVIWVSLFHKQNSRLKINDIAVKWSISLLHIVKAKYKIINDSNIDFQRNQSYIIMSNHASHYDIPLIFVAFPNQCVRMIAKKELFKVPVWGRALAVGEFISIDRVNRRQAVQDLRIAKEKMSSGVIPWIAPEGTRTRTGEMQAFKKGGFMLALQTKATIIPVGIKGSGKILPPKTSKYGVGENIEIHIGKPIEMQNYTAKDVAELIHEVEVSIKNLVENSNE